MIVVLNLFDMIPGKEPDYAEYLRRVQPILERHNARILLYGLTKMVHLGNLDRQYCGLIGYDTLDDLRRFSHDPEFKEIRPLRDDSTENYILTSVESFPSLDEAAKHLDNA